jgi:hypothetical protein
MGDERLISRRSGLSGKGFGDLIRRQALRCTRTVNLEAHHVITTAGSDMNNIQMLCHECHTSTETHGTPSGFSPLPFSEGVKAAARLRCQGRCECTKAHPGHGSSVLPEVPTLSRRL